MAEYPVPEMTRARHVLHDLGFFGHFLHVNAGGRSGQQHILVSLLKHGGHMTQRELQDEACISSGALSEVLAKLEASGHIERTRSEDDRRQLDITLTDEGTTRATTVIEQRRSFEAICLECFDDQEQEQLTQLLDRLVEHWESLPGKEGCA